MCNVRCHHSENMQLQVQSKTRLVHYLKKVNTTTRHSHLPQGNISVATLMSNLIPPHNRNLAVDSNENIIHSFPEENKNLLLQKYF